jgi:hypothetical protein
VKENPMIIHCLLKSLRNAQKFLFIMVEVHVWIHYANDRLQILSLVSEVCVDILDLNLLAKYALE